MPRATSQHNLLSFLVVFCWQSSISFVNFWHDWVLQTNSHHGYRFIFQKISGIYYKLLMSPRRVFLGENHHFNRVSCPALIRTSRRPSVGSATCPPSASRSGWRTHRWRRLDRKSPSWCWKKIRTRRERKGEAVSTWSGLIFLIWELSRSSP